MFFGGRKPDSAIGNDQSEKFVFVVDANNKVRRQVVEIGPQSSGLRVIRKGLTGSERIVVRGLQRVRPGIDVAPTNEQLVAKSDDGLPDDYEPLPKEEWISLHQQTPVDQRRLTSNKVTMTSAYEARAVSDLPRRSKPRGSN